MVKTRNKVNSDITMDHFPELKRVPVRTRLSSNTSDSSVDITKSGDFGSEVDSSFLSKSTDSDMEVSRSHNYMTSSADEQSFSFKNEQFKKQIPLSSEPSLFSSPKMAAAIIVAVTAILMFWLSHQLKLMYPKLSMAPKNCTTLLESSQNFPMHNPRFWKELQTGIEHVQNDEPPQPAVFLFVYSDQRLLTKVLNHITATTTVCLGSLGGAINVPNSELQSQDMIDDYGKLIEKYKPKLETQRVMIVRDIQHMPSAVSRAFHVFCDTSFPVVKKSVYFFTMQMRDEDIPSDINGLYETVEHRLRELWQSGVDKDKIQPLITRMTDNVLSVKLRVS